MKRSMMGLGNYGIALAGLALLVAGGCGDDGGSGNTTTSSDTSVTSAGDTATSTSTGDTANSTTQADTSMPADTTQTVSRVCTDDELTTLNSCGDACNSDQTCLQGCFSAMSTPCQQAYNALIQCAQANGCGDDVNCIASNCPAEVLAVFGDGSDAADDCDPVTNDGCEAGENCTLVSETAVGCVPAGPATIDQTCGQQAPCATGACLTTDGTNFQCFEFCDGFDNQCPEGRPCNISSPDGSFTFCGDVPVDCDLYAQDCAPPEGCYIVDQAGSTDCAPHQGKGEGEACAAINECGPGTLCVGEPGACRAICNTDGTTPCTSGTCTGIGVGTVGACAP